MVADGERDLWIAKLKNAVLDADFDGTPEITRQALEAGLPPQVLMKEALSEGVKGLETKLFGGDKVWLHPVFLMSMEGVRRALEILEPHIEMKDEDALGTVVMGTPAGDTHDLGGKMAALALIAAGFRVDYLGQDVPSISFIHKVQETDADILGISSYQSSGFKKIEEILDLLEKLKLRDKVKVILGGSVITDKYADQMKVDYGRHASDAVKLATEYMGGQ